MSLESRGRLLDARATLPFDAGKDRRTNENRGEMNRRFQIGHVFKRGKRRKVWVGCYRELVLAGGQLKRMQRRQVIGKCAEMTKSQAEKRLVEILRPLNAGRPPLEQTMTFGEFAETWEKEILIHYRESTRGFYKRTLGRWILPHFKERKLSEIRTLEVQSFVNQFADYSKSVLKHLRATLSLIVKTALTWELIERNPVGEIKLPPGKSVERAPVLMPEQIAQLIARLVEPYRTMVVIASTTGMRKSEVLALRWEDFDRKAQVIHVRRSLYRGKDRPTEE